jgi:hypothetical protein
MVDKLAGVMGYLGKNYTGVHVLYKELRLTVFPRNCSFLSGKVLGSVPKMGKPGQKSMLKVAEIHTYALDWKFVTIVIVDNNHLVDNYYHY